jgi:hypothetical protein
MIKKKKDVEHSMTNNITKEDVKAKAEFEHLTDDQANEVVNFIITYCDLVYKAYNSGKLNPPGNKILTKRTKK